METAIIESTTEASRDLSEYFAYWKNITRDNEKLPAHIFLLHDLILNRDPKKNSFSPITNKNKLNNGCTRWSSLIQAKKALDFCSLNKPNKRESKLMELSATYNNTDLKAKLNCITSKP